jgi:hypothetical protein
MKRIKNTYRSVSIQDIPFLMDVLNRLLYGISCRLILQISFLILPVLSYGQLLYTEDNTLPVVGLENRHQVHQQKIEACLFVTSNTVITTTAETVLYVNGLIQMDTIFVTYSEFTRFATALPKKLPYKVKPAPKVATSEVQKNRYQSALPAFPWNKNPLQQEIFFASVVVTFLPTTPTLKKKDTNPCNFFQSYTALFQGGITKGYSVCSTCSVTATFGKNSTEFSPRPPPVSNYI